MRKRITYEELDIREDGTIWYNGEPKNCHIANNGYYTTSFSGKSYAIHRLIAEKYIPNPENKRTVNHINGIKTDNRVSNLEWNTYQENNQHAHATGLKGMLQLRLRKLDDKTVKIVRDEYSKGLMTYRGLSKKYGITYCNIGKLIRRENYKDVV